MTKRSARCPRCRRTYGWGATVCPACHVALDLFADPAPGAPEVAVFETGDRASAEIVAGLLGAHGLACAIRGTDDGLHGTLWWTGYFRVLVRAADEAQAQVILDGELGREPKG